jgi:hypothetical protein
MRKLVLWGTRLIYKIKGHQVELFITGSHFYDMGLHLMTRKFQYKF